MCMGHHGPYNTGKRAPSSPREDGHDVIPPAWALAKEGPGGRENRGMIREQDVGREQYVSRKDGSRCFQSCSHTKCSQQGQWQAITAICHDKIGPILVICRKGQAGEQDRAGLASKALDSRAACTPVSVSRASPPHLGGCPHVADDRRLLDDSVSYVLLGLVVLPLGVTQVGAMMDLVIRGCHGSQMRSAGGMPRGCRRCMEYSTRSLATTPCWASNRMQAPQGNKTSQTYPDRRYQSIAET